MGLQARISGLSVLIVSILIILAGCAGEEQPHARITLSPTSASVHINRSLQFSATLTNSTNTGLTWTVSGNGCTGASCGTISDTGLYTAPAVIPDPDQVRIMVTSAADSISAYVWVTILPAIGLAVTPPDPTVAVDSDLQFTANIRNALDGRVNWTVSGPGTISPTGRYTAPSVVPAVPTVTITATSVEDPLTSASATALIASSCVGVEWAWESGGIYYNQSGVYGTLGIPSPSNVPGARGAAASWLDTSGSFWLFGGAKFDYTIYNDLWRYDPSSQLWTWVSGSNIKNQPGSFGTRGVPDPSNVPGARCESVSWIDSSGKLWLFGGSGIYPDAYTHGNDLWRYDPTTNEWTWMSGADRADQPGIYGTMGVPDPANMPGGRCLAAAWRDTSGNFWLFGGRGLDAAGSIGILSDLWIYDPTTNLWTWISGSDVVDQAGVHGTKGVPDPANSPGARYRAAYCVDPSGVFWLFGGSDWEYFRYFNDLWTFNPATHLWTWVSGSDASGQAGVYGTRGVTDPASVPGARNLSISWVDPTGRFWLFGGGGFDSTGNTTVLNDLWMFDPSTLQWTWVSGSKTGQQLGYYGIKGVADPSSVPGARYSATGGLDALGRFWLFGGYSCDSVTCFGHINDLWSVIR